MAGVRVVASAVAAGLAAGLTAASAGGQTAKLPSQLAGSWTHFFSAAYWAKAGISDEPPEHLSLYIPAVGSAAVGEIYFRISLLSGNRLAISGRFPDCGKVNAVYHWTVASRRLTLAKIKDGCKESAAIFDGVAWVRE